MRKSEKQPHPKTIMHFRFIRFFTLYLPVCRFKPKKRSYSYRYRVWINSECIISFWLSGKMEIAWLMRKRIKLKLERVEKRREKDGGEIEKAPLVYVRYRSELWISHLYVNPHRLRRSKIHGAPGKWVTTIAGDKPRSYDFINSSHIFARFESGPNQRGGFATSDRRADDRRSTDRDDIWHARQREKIEFTATFGIHRKIFRRHECVPLESERGVKPDLHKTYRWVWSSKYLIRAHHRSFRIIMDEIQ